jgi:hypothetical protein
MPWEIRMSIRMPKYRLHKGSGQALLQINGHRIYLGKYGTAESKQKYRRIMAQWLEQQATRRPVVNPTNLKLAKRVMRKMG